MTTTVEVAWGDREADDHTATRTPFLWWDTQDPGNLGWVLRTFADGDPTDTPVDGGTADDPGEALDHARRLLPQPGAHPDDLRSDLDDLGRRYAELSRTQAELTVGRRDLIPRARAAGIGVTEIAERTGLTRRAVYDLIESA